MLLDYTTKSSLVIGKKYRFCILEAEFADNAKHIQLVVSMKDEARRRTINAIKRFKI